MHRLTQTLTTLNLSNNAISYEGAQHLARAFEHNTVSLLFSFRPSFAFPFSHIDTNYIELVGQ
jgi:hypothetical protein